MHFFCLLSIACSSRWSDDGEMSARDITLTFTTFVMSDMWNAWGCRSPHKSVLSLGLFANKALNIAVACVVTGQLALIYVPFLQVRFSSTRLAHRARCARPTSRILSSVWRGGAFSGQAARGRVDALPRKRLAPRKRGLAPRKRLARRAHSRAPNTVRSARSPRFPTPHSESSAPKHFPSPISPGSSSPRRASSSRTRRESCSSGPIAGAAFSPARAAPLRSASPSCKRDGDGRVSTRP